MNDKRSVHDMRKERFYNAAFKFALAMMGVGFVSCLGITLMLIFGGPK